MERVQHTRNPKLEGQALRPWKLLKFLFFFLFGKSRVQPFVGILHNSKMSHPRCVYINNSCGYQSMTQQYLKRCYYRPLLNTFIDIVVLLTDTHAYCVLHFLLTNGLYAGSTTVHSSHLISTMKCKIYSSQPLASNLLSNVLTLLLETIHQGCLQRG